MQHDIAPPHGLVDVAPAGLVGVDGADEHLHIGVGPPGAVLRLRLAWSEAMARVRWVSAW